jgi:hypothetical protein
MRIASCFQWRTCHIGHVITLIDRLHRRLTRSVACDVIFCFVRSSSAAGDVYLDTRICNEIRIVNKVELCYNVMKGAEYFMWV